MRASICRCAFIWLAMTAGAMAGSPSTTQSSGADGFEFPMQKGQYILVGHTIATAAGTDKKPPEAEKVEPLFKGFIANDAMTDKWSVHVAVRDTLDISELSDKGGPHWKLILIWNTNRGADGEMLWQERRGWRPGDIVRDKSKSAVMQIEEIKAGPASVPGAELHRFVLTLDGDPQGLVLVIGDKDAIRKAIPVWETGQDGPWDKGWLQISQKPIK